MINKLLITCLQRNKRLIIPGLGAFIRKNVDGVGIILVFVPFLNKDDGVLLSALQSWAGVEKDEAEMILKEYVEYIRKSLNERGQYIIEGVGVLKYDANKVIYLAKESEAVKEEVAEKVEPQPEQQSTIPTQEKVPAIEPEKTIPVPVPEEQPRVLKQTIPSFPVSPSESEEKPVSTPHSPVSGHGNIQSSYPPQPNRNSGIGARYFSPKEDTVSTSSNINGSERPVEVPVGESRRQTVNSLYGNNSTSRPSGPERPIPPQVHRGNSQQRTANLYGTIPVNPNKPDVPSQTGGPVRPAQVSGQNRRRPVPKTGKKKGSDMVFVIAIIAIIATILVLIYGWIFGADNATFEDLPIEEGVPAMVDQSSGVVQE